MGAAGCDNGLAVRPFSIDGIGPSLPQRFSMSWFLPRAGRCADKKSESKQDPVADLQRKVTEVKARLSAAVGRLRSGRASRQ